MLKVIFRTIVILLAAGLVSAGLYFWVNQGGGLPGGSELLTAESGRHAFDRQGTDANNLPPDFDTQGMRPERLSGKGEFHGGENLQRGWADLGSKLGLVALVTAGVALVRWLIRRIPRLIRQRAAV